MKQLYFKNIEFESVECLFCKGKTEKEFLFEVPDRINNLPGMFSLVRCRKCGLVFQSPRPKEEYIKYYYPDSTGYYLPKNNKKQSKIKKWIEKNILINFYNHNNLGKKNYFVAMLVYLFYFYFYRHQSIPYYIKDGKLLEIGCSYGRNLVKFRRYGWKVKGVELNKKAANYGIRKNIDIKIGSIFDYKFPVESFDVVIMDMALEHLYKPDEAILQITKWLKPGGQLIFSIPYFEGFEFKFFKEYAYGIHLPAHLYFFNRNNVEKLLRGYYKNIKFIFQHFDRDIVASCYYKYQSTGKYFFKFVAYNKIIRYLLIKPLVFLLSLFKRTSRITVYAQKNN